MKNRNGFTFIQILMAVAILAVAFIPIGKIFSASNKNVQHSSAVLEASVFAATLIDNLRNARFIKDNLNKRVYIPANKKDKIKQYLDPEDNNSDITDRDSSFSNLTSFEIENRKRREVLFSVDNIPEHFRKRYQGLAYFVVKNNTDSILKDIYKIKVKVIWFENGKVKTKVLETLKAIIGQDKLSK